MGPATQERAVQPPKNEASECVVSMNNMAKKATVSVEMGYVAGSAVVGMHGSRQQGQSIVCIEQHGL